MTPDNKTKPSAKRGTFNVPTLEEIDNEVREYCMKRISCTKCKYLRGLHNNRCTAQAVYDKLTRIIRRLQHDK